ncbi:uncharacterized protein LOC110726939 [Chenopodium quinoa]|uniref:uncharacterized protein LOC110726939 n=1 Tax=Chenopodium quinoa TaxID=63459 RepID=UPI000B772AA3|nr:uncharacterized protein LOC110726939 [Chenopodium quinoa]
MQPARSLLDNTVRASIDKDANEGTQANQLLYISILQGHVIDRSIASNLYLVERSLEDCRFPVFRYSVLPPSRVFVEGFNAREEGDTPIEQYCDYNLYMMRGPQPLSTRSSFSHAFVSTSGNVDWTPIPRPQQPLFNMYRYKIFAPGGIIAEATLKNYKYKPVDEITFVGSIRPCYIHSAQLFELHRRSSTDYVERVVANEIYYVNSRFSPGPDLLREGIDPAHDYMPSGLMHTVVYPPLVPIHYRDYYADIVPPNP